LIIVLVNWF